MKVIYIHGAGSSHVSFEYIRMFAKSYDPILLEYSTKKSFRDNLAEMIIRLERDYPSPEEFVIMAHSLGGIYAIHLAESLGDELKGIVTLSTPFGGIESADVFKFIKNDDFYWEIGPNDWPIRKAQEIKVNCPHMIVATKGGRSSLISGENDGVVTLKSMTSREPTYGEHFIVDLNHFEILLSQTPIYALYCIVTSNLENMKDDPSR